MNSPVAGALPASSVPLPLERDLFLRTLLSHLANALQKVVGLEEASGFISIVGQEVGNEINTAYRQGLSVERLSRAQVADVLVDLKQRIKGDFFIVEESDERIVLGSRSCPFADKVIGRPALCMMTSNVFGVIAAQNLGYARVEIQESIARGHAGCRVVVHLKPSDGAGREYFAAA